MNLIEEIQSISEISFNLNLVSMADLFVAEITRKHLMEPRQEN